MFPQTNSNLLRLLIAARPVWDQWVGGSGGTGPEAQGSCWKALLAREDGWFACF